MLTPPYLRAPPPVAFKYSAAPALFPILILNVVEDVVPAAILYIKVCWFGEPVPLRDDSAHNALTVASWNKAHPVLPAEFVEVHPKNVICK